MTPTLADRAEMLLAAARRAGAEAADALVAEGVSTSIEIRRGALEKAERAEGIELGLRVLVGRRQACVAASDASPATVAAMAERAVAMAREAPEDPYAGLAEPGQLARDWQALALDIAEPGEGPSPAVLEALARRAEAAALGRAGIVQVEAAASRWTNRVAVAMTNGFAGGYARTQSSLSASAFTGEGTAMEHDWAAEARTHLDDLPAAEEIGALAAERALARRGARKPATGACPVLYDERVAGSLIGHLLAAVNGAAVARGASWLRDAMGEPVLPAGIDLTEDPHRPRAVASKPFDAEGLPTRRRAIVADGILRGWTLDLAAARKLGLAPTGNAGRSAGAPPAPGVTNTELTPGTADRARLLADMGSGLLVTALLGATINPTTGDYSRGASGFWVERGEIAYPVNECTIAGNLRDMLRRMVPANDARPQRTSRVPSLLVEGLTLAGA
jgi:PmbA protein